MGKTRTVLFAAIAALVVTPLASGSGVAAAAPAAPVALLTLTTWPGGWQGRTDLRPILEVSADGRAVKSPDAADPNRGSDKAPQRVDGHIPADVLSAAVTETKAVAALDLGMPSNSDQGSQIIDLMTQAPDQDVHVVMYAPDSTENLSAEQQANRKRFSELYRKLVDAFVQG
ncbi:hypothetical protein [Nocardia arthritidis]|uniref:Secreted protein n=1 Tax=Nocardia arthritidis TaxID=228602 RepID=A0A6G9YJV1_9NOCA|nr:hypothetical protein [Nocardia arthritidis]QIS13474.1 hypothetical protein F5544_28105 [Nocardia arthritidis]